VTGPDAGPDEPVAEGSPSVSGVGRAVAGAGLAELCTVPPDGTPTASVVTPLWHDGAAWVALSYADQALARRTASVGRAALVLSDPNHAAAGASGLAIHGPVTLVEDPAGDRFQVDLMDQQLRKHPPSRALLDSVILRREHWWYVPRLLLRLEPESWTAVPPRTDPRGSALLVCAADGGAEAASGVRVRAVALPGTDGAVDAAGCQGPALLLGHDASSDLERSVELRVDGRCDDGTFVPAEDVGPDGLLLPPLPAPPSLLTRWSRQRALRRACEAGLREAGLA
jgi:hypothetical protein